MQSFSKRLVKLLSAPAALSGRMLAAVSLIATIMTAILLTFCGPALLTGAQRYNDLVVGEITFADAYKHGDIVAPFVAVISFFSFWWLSALLATRISGALEEADTQSKSSLPWLPCLFICYFAGIMLFRKEAAYAETGISIILMVAYCLLVKLYGRQVDQEKMSFALLAGVVTAGGLFFTVAGLGVAMKFFFPQAIPSWYPAQLPLYSGSLGLLSMLFMTGLRELWLLRIALAAQLLTPLLLLAAFSRVYESLGVVTQNYTPLFTKCVAATLTLLMLFAGALQLLRRRSISAAKPRDLLLLTSVVAVASYLAYSIPPFLNTDMFHIGELLLAWQQPFDKGLSPFSGFAVARGFNDAGPGLLNAILFDGTFATYTFAMSVASVFFAVLNSILLCSLLGNGWGIVFVLAGACNGGTFLLVLLLLVQPRLLNRPLLWIFVWCVVCPLYCLYHTTSGIALTAGTLPVAVWIVYSTVREGYFAKAWHNSKLWLLIGIGIMVVELCLLSPVLISWATYVMEQGKVNEIANGTPLLRELAIPSWFRWQSRWVWEGFRVGGWLIGIFLLWHLFVRERGGILPATNACVRFVSSVEAIALTGVVSTLAFIPYSMGRIDSKVLSRTGAVTLFVMCILLPLVLILGKRVSSVPAMFIAVFLLGIGNAAYYEAPVALARKAVQAINVPVGAQWTEGRSISPLFGDTFVDSDTMANVMALKGVMDRVVLPGETYFDLTNHVGYYYLLNYKVPAIYAGYYTVAGEDTQNRVIHELKKDPPPLVWAGPARTFGSGTASIRSYRLYRWFLQNGYLPLQGNGIQFLVREDRYKALFGALPSLSQQARELAATFNNGYLGGIPLAWGRNMDSLAPRFKQFMVSLQQTALSQGGGQEASHGAAVPVVTLELKADVPIQGVKSDFMKLRFGGPSAPIQLRVSWSESGSPFVEWRSVAFEAQPDTPLLIPLGSHPDWLLSREIGKIRFEFIGMQRAGDLVLEPPAFLLLVK